MLNGCNRSKTDMFVFQWNAFNWLDLTSMSQLWGNQARSGDGEHPITCTPETVSVFNEK